MFGLVTKRELDQLRADLVKDVRDGKALQEELAYEWAKWFNKFRSLYAMLLKREKSAADDGAGVEETPAPSAPAVPPSLVGLRRRLRGF